MFMEKMKKWFRHNHDAVIWLPISLAIFVIATLAMRVCGLKVYDPGILQGLLIGFVRFTFIMTIVGWWMRVVFPSLWKLIIENITGIERWKELTPFGKSVLGVALYIGLGLIGALCLMA
jgi:hypothetical protein